MCLEVVWKVSRFYSVFFCGTAGTDRTRQVSIKSYTAGWCPVCDYRCQECACKVSGKYMGCAELVRKGFGICLDGLSKGSEGCQEIVQKLTERFLEDVLRLFEWCLEDDPVGVWKVT